MHVQPTPLKSLSRQPTAGAACTDGIQGQPADRARRAANSHLGFCHLNRWKDDTANARHKWCPRVTFLEDFQKPEKDQSNLHPAGHKYASGHQHSHMEWELVFFLNNPGKIVSDIDSIFDAFTVKAFQSKMLENILRPYFQTWLAYELAKNPPSFSVMIKKDWQFSGAFSSLWMQHFLALGSALKPAPFIFHIIPHESIRRNSVLMLSVMSAEQKKASSDTKVLVLCLPTPRQKQTVFQKSTVN